MEFTVRYLQYIICTSHVLQFLVIIYSANHGPPKKVRSGSSFLFPCPLSANRITAERIATPGSLYRSPGNSSNKRRKSCVNFCSSVFRFVFFNASAWHRKLVQVFNCILSTPRPDYISQRPLLPHTHKSKALASG